ncbi:MAG: DNA gyrase inhibitor YacG [Gammaproteobacteria bacterium]|nr:DNA gyrase inhibitor YacG [Gammaproteobacteria bacterium]MYE99518.1 DNA gyrase inhibitor YacG [Gammaproteobacteria bacterium]
MNDEIDSINCPNCGKEVEWTKDNRFRPFCCERCRLIDLGEWAAENYRVPGEPSAPPDIPDSGSLQ